MEESWALAQGLEREGLGVGEGSGRVTHRHVRPCSNEGVGHGVDELATHAKVAQFDLTTRVHQDVGGLYVCRDQKERPSKMEGQGPNPSGTTCLFIPDQTPFLQHTQQKHFERCSAYCKASFDNSITAERTDMQATFHLPPLKHRARGANNSVDIQRFHTWWALLQP